MNERKNATAAGGAQTETTASWSPAFERELERVLARVPPLIRLPKPKTRCPWTGESRTGLLELVAPSQRNEFKPPVRAIYRRAHKYAQRGVWLIPAENLFRYLLGLADQSANEYLARGKARASAKEAA